HILEAVHHLDAAGMHAEADHLRRECDQQMRTAIAKLRTAETELAHGPHAPATKNTQADSAVTEPSHHGKQVLVPAQMLELNRTKMRNLGFDFASINPGNFVASSVSAGLLQRDGSNTAHFATVTGPTAFFGFLDALRQENVVKTLANPSVVTVSGRPA